MKAEAKRCEQEHRQGLGLGVFVPWEQVLTLPLNMPPSQDGRVPAGMSWSEGAARRGTGRRADGCWRRPLPLKLDAFLPG